MTKMTDAQIRAQKKYDEKNREERNYTKQKSTTKTFIRKAVKKGRKEDLLELTDMIEDKLKEMENMEKIKELSWEEFMSLDEVQVEGDELFYNNGEIQVSVNFQPKVIDENDEVVQEGHDDTTLWEDEELAEELRELVIEEMEN